jgi:YVTN family beta-propeller protein
MPSATDDPNGPTPNDPLSTTVGRGALLGSRFGRYQIQSLIGRGGMGAVYLAKDDRLRRTVAVKVLLPELANDETFRERFIRESRVAASLDHPNIVAIYEADEVSGMLYLAMQYVEGSDLRALIGQKEPLELGRVIEILSQIASALDAAHERGLVHRDVKPANILLAIGAGAREHAYLTDFGLAKTTAGDASLTRVGELLGTPDYMAPEQIRGEQVDTRTDVYSLGCVFFECLTGEVPFKKQGDVAAIYELFAHLDEPPRLPSSVREAISPELDLVVVRAMAKDRDARPARCGELMSYARRASERSGRSGRWRAWRTRRQMRRVARRGHPARRASLALGGLLLAASLTVASIEIPRSMRSGTQPSHSVGLPPHVTASLQVGKSPSTIGFGARAAWVPDFARNEVFRIDPSTDKVVSSISVPGEPLAVATTRGSVWVATFNGVVRINARTDHIVQFGDSRADGIGGGGGGTIAAGFGSVWAGTLYSVLRISPRTNRVSGEVFVGVGTVLSGGEVSNAIATGEGAVWVIDSAHDSVQRINPRQNKVVRTIHVGAAPRGLAVGEGSVWVVNTVGNNVSRIDPATNKVIATIRVSSAGKTAAPQAVVVSNGMVWVASTDDKIWIIDPTKNRVVGAVSVAGSPSTLSVGDGTIWVTFHGSNLIQRIAP